MGKKCLIYSTIQNTGVRVLLWTCSAFIFACCGSIVELRFSDEFLSACSTLHCVGAENKTKQKTFTKGSADGVASPMAALMVRQWPSSISISHQNVNVEWINPHFYEKITISNSLTMQKHHVITGLLIGSWDIWMQFSTLFYWLVSLDLLTIMPWNKSHKILLIINQYWFRQWVGVVRQQAITWANVDLDLCRHMPSLGLNVFMHFWRSAV